MTTSVHTFHHAQEYSAFYLGEIAKQLEKLAIGADKMERTLETILSRMSPWSSESFADVHFRNEVLQYGFALVECRPAGCGDAFYAMRRIRDLTRNDEIIGLTAEHQLVAAGGE
jgi:hypothetical protein